MSAAPRRLGMPRPIAVRERRAGPPLAADGDPAAARIPLAADGDPAAARIPLAVDGHPVEAVIEEWVVEDRWWTGRPLRRRYLELLLANGRNVVVFRDLTDGRWFEQRA